MRLSAALLPLLLAACATAPPAVYSGDFTTARGEFVVCGDTRGWIMGELWRAPSGFERRAVFDRLAEERPDFVLNTGDLVAAGSDDAQWEVFDVETAALRAAGVAYLPALGNHDLWPSTDGGLANWFARFAFLHGKRWYEVRYGYVELLVVDTNQGALSADETAEQAQWFRGRIAAADDDATVRCVMVAMHHAPITNSVFHGSSPWARAQFVEPALASKKTKAFLTGHVHSYEHFVENGVHFLVSGGGGAPLMDVDGPTGANRDLYDGPRRHHFVRVIPRDDRVEFEVEMLDDERRWFRADAWSIPIP